MPLKNGRSLRALPGPSIMPDRVLRAMHRAAPNIYGGALTTLVDTIQADLCRMAATSGKVALLIGNGHAAWEAALVNTLAPGDKALVVVTGRFGYGWADMATALGIDVELMAAEPGCPTDPAALTARLRADKAHEIKAVLATQTDTATSLANDIPGLRAAIDAAGHPALYMIDGIASFGCEPFAMDDSGVDVYVTGCQKGLMTPPGMSFNFVNAKAEARRAQMPRVSPYFDWQPRFTPKLFYKIFCGTAPTHHLFGLREALDMIFEEGIDAIWIRHRTLARMVWAAVDQWGADGAFRLNVSAPDARSIATTTILTGPGEAERLRTWCEAEANLTLGLGLGIGDANSLADGSIFRIGHMGHQNLPGMMGVLGTIEAGLSALSIPHSQGGVAAAAQVAAEAMGAG